jgi:hypothetical protein
MRTLLICSALAIAGCASATQYVATGTSSVQAGRQDRAQRGRAWMDIAAKKVDLLYISDGNGDVTVYTYWQKTLVGQLTGFAEPKGECVDERGDVFITDNAAKRVVEYAHAGKKPIQVLDDSPYAPYACSVDLATGTLAVANEAGSSSQGNVAIYAHASGTPKLYADKEITDFQACAYDSEGNLLVSGSPPRSYTSFAWLPKHGGRLVNVSMPGPVGSWTWESVTGLQWDGRYFVIDDYELYRVSVIEAQAYYEGQTDLYELDAYGPFWIYNDKPNKRQGTQVVGAYNGSSSGGVYYWNYPAGGDAVGYISGITQPFAVTVSLGKIHE